MDTDVYRAFYPEHWRVSQQKTVEDVCAAEDTPVWIAIDSDRHSITLFQALFAPPSLLVVG